MTEMILYQNLNSIPGNRPMSQPNKHSHRLANLQHPPQVGHLVELYSIGELGHLTRVRGYQ